MSPLSQATAASYGIEVAARNLPVGKNDRIVILADRFPSNANPTELHDFCHRCPRAEAARELHFRN